MKKNGSSVTQYVIIVFLMIITLSVYAQKLPDKQSGSIWVPTDAKANKITDWDKKFQAYNNNNRIWYTIANDDDNLYLIIRAKGLFVNEKIMRSGLSFTIRASDKKNSKPLKNDVNTTFPIIENKKDLLTILRSSEVYRSLRKDTAGNRKKIDSLQLVLNKMSGSFLKEIKVTGMKDITDTLVSVYNTDGIKTIVTFDSQIQYICKLVIPLKYLASAMNNGEKFSYNIKLDVPPDSESDTIVGRPKPEMDNGKIYLDNSNPDDFYRFVPTDFWGDYVLAKKPN